MPFGEEGWFERWNARDRVEGSFGTIKNLALMHWGHDYHHFVGLVRETLVATFAVVAYNVHAERNWKAKIALSVSAPHRRRHRRSNRVEDKLERDRIVDNDESAEVGAKASRVPRFTARRPIGRPSPIRY